MRIDTSDLDALITQWRQLNVAELVSPVLSKAGANMRNQMRNDAPAGAHLKKYRDQLWFKRDGKLAVEAGAFGQAQGRLAAILEFGQGPNGAHPHILRTIDAEAPAAAKWILDVVSKALT